MTRATLLALAERVEAATGAQQAEMLNAARDAILGGAVAVVGSRLDGAKWNRMIDAEAYESAAMSLVPSGWRWHSYYWPRKDAPKLMSLVTDLPHAGVVHGKASTPALALTAACLRARAIAGSV